MKEKQDPICLVRYSCACGAEHLGELNRATMLMIVRCPDVGMYIVDCARPLES